MVHYFRRLLWLHRHKYLWWQRRSPSREFSTRIYEGLPGSGKSVQMCADVIRLMRSGVVVASNMSIVDPEFNVKQNKVLRTLPCNSMLEIMELSVWALENHISLVIALDEIHLIFDARLWDKVPHWMLNLFAQRRHFGIGIMGTTQDMAQVEKRLRTLVDFLLQVNLPLRRWPGIFKRIPLLLVRQLNAKDIDTMDRSTVEKPRAFPTFVPWYGYHGYSTMELMASTDFAAMKDEDVINRVAELTARAHLIALPAGAPDIFNDEACQPEASSEDISPE